MYTTFYTISDDKGHHIMFKRIHMSMEEPPEAIQGQVSNAAILVHVNCRSQEPNHPILWLVDDRSAS